MAILKPIVGVIKNYTIGIFIVLFMLTQFCLYAQKNKISCDYLQKIIETKEFNHYNLNYLEEKPIEVFDKEKDDYVYKMPKEVYKSDTINIIDLTNTFNNCGTVKWYNYTINITDKNPRSYKPPKYDREANNMDIVIAEVKKTKGNFFIFFVSPFDNSTIQFSICKKKGKYIIRETERGSF